MEASFWSVVGANPILAFMALCVICTSMVSFAKVFSGENPTREKKQVGDEDTAKKT